MTEIERYNKFAEAAMLDKKHDPYYRRKEKGCIYATCMIISSEQPNWWYSEFIGVEFMGLLQFSKYAGGEYLRQVIAVHISGVYIHHGRSLSTKDIIIL